MRADHARAAAGRYVDRRCRREKRIPGVEVEGRGAVGRDAARARRLMRVSRARTVRTATVVASRPGPEPTLVSTNRPRARRTPRILAAMHVGASGRTNV